MYQNLHAGGGQVFHLAGLDLAFLHSLGNRLDECLRGFGEWYLAYHKGLVVQLLYLGAYLEHAATLAVVVFRHVDAAACGEVGIKGEGLAMQVMDGGVAQLAEVMGQDFRRQTYGDALGTLRQKQWKLHGQGDGFLVATIVGELPFSGLRIEHHVEGEFRQSCLDVTGGGGGRSRKDIAPVALCVDEQVLLSHLYQGIADGSVAVGVELHGVAYDVGHFVVTPVVHSLHRMENAALDGLQTVLDVGHGSLKDDIGGIVEEPVLVHATEVVHRRGVEAVGGSIVDVALGRIGVFRIFEGLGVFGVFRLVCLVRFFLRCRVLAVLEYVVFYFFVHRCFFLCP